MRNSRAASEGAGRGARGEGLAAAARAACDGRLEAAGLGAGCASGRLGAVWEWSFYSLLRSRTRSRRTSKIESGGSIARKCRYDAPSHTTAACTIIDDENDAQMDLLGMLRKSSS